jgi:putative Holliday junction resolvase
MRFVGLDVGLKRIGVAVSDASGTLARPVGALASQGRGPAVEPVAAEVRRLTDDDGLAAVVVGLPRRLDGRPTDLTPVVEAFARQLEAHMGVPVHLQDERLSSREAESRLALREKDWRERKKKIDAAAAAIILQDYLDSHAPVPTHPGDGLPEDA